MGNACAAFVHLDTSFFVWNTSDILFRFSFGGGVMVGFQALLVSGASDGLLIIWSADHGHDSRELVPKLSLKVSLFFLCLVHFVD